MAIADVPSLLASTYCSASKSRRAMRVAWISSTPSLTKCFAIGAIPPFLPIATIYLSETYLAGTHRLRQQTFFPPPPLFFFFFFFFFQRLWAARAAILAAGGFCTLHGLLGLVTLPSDLFTPAIASCRLFELHYFRCHGAPRRGIYLPERFGSFWCHQLAVVPEESCAFGVSKFQSRLRRVLMMGEMVTGECMPQSVVRPMLDLGGFQRSGELPPIGDTRGRTGPAIFR